MEEELIKINEEVLKEIEQMKNLNRGNIALIIASVYLTLQGKNYQGIKEWFTELRKGLKTGRTNYKEVLTGIEITSNFMTEENLKNLLEQKEQASTYMMLFQDYFEEGRKKANEEDFITPVAPNIKQEMDTKSARVKQLSKQYVK